MNVQAAGFLSIFWRVMTSHGQCPRGGACECPSGGVFVNFLEGDDVTRTMSKGGCL